MAQFYIPGQKGTVCRPFRGSDTLSVFRVVAMIRSYKGQWPTLGARVYVDVSAQVIGAVTLGDHASVWMNATLRGDVNAIRLGEATNVQDNCVLHCTAELATVVGDDCVVGHMVHLEGCTIEAGCLIGNGSIVLHRVVVHSGAIVAANAVVLNDTIVPPGALAMGVPAKIREDAARQGEIDHGVASYLQKAERYRRELRRVE